MIQKLSVPVSVEMIYDHKSRKVFPKFVLWGEKIYPITKIGLHHTFREGRVLYHAFSVCTKSVFFRLILDSETLHWRLEEISDGLPD
jgi:hypothetical protein